MNNRINIKAVIDFSFIADPDMTPAEMMAEFIDRIKCGEYCSRDLVDLQVIPA